MSTCTRCKTEFETSELFEFKFCNACVLQVSMSQLLGDLRDYTKRTKKDGSNAKNTTACDICDSDRYELRHLRESTRR